MEKKIALLCVALIFVFLMQTSVNAEVLETLHTTALCKDPTDDPLKTKKICNLLQGTKLEVIETKPYEKSGMLLGHWYKVKVLDGDCTGKEGWVYPFAVKRVGR
ncbi:SH3 domain-containing protein [Thermodesulfovibrio yellowstonii]|uniref:SH3 domain-containing protein n=1 Tax=Thermodesulfovibrio yellowstonii TaxID=28262 RepID=UPI00041E817B|nr:SH3 domain-containing protein [Thermodesulfovibrio islandicus]